jgi:hypothetical protein
LRRALSLVLAIALCFSLCACGAGGKSARELAEDIQETYSAAEEISFTAAVKADCGDAVYTYRVRLSGDTLEILEPECIAGITARLDGDGAHLSYDGAELWAGEISSGGLSPLDAAAQMGAKWSEGYVSQCVFERVGGVSAVMLKIPLGDDEYLSTWFDEQTYLPLYAEAVSGGRTAVTFEFENTELG